jgi:hypothetical protein
MYGTVRTVLVGSSDLHLTVATRVTITFHFSNIVSELSDLIFDYYK